MFERLRDEKDMLIVPGEFFAMDRYLRVGFGCEPEILEIGLARIAELLATLKAESGETARA